MLKLTLEKKYYKKDLDGISLNILTGRSFFRRNSRTIDGTNNG
jgi:hypothetical protein